MKTFRNFLGAMALTTAAALAAVAPGCTVGSGSAPTPKDDKPTIIDSDGDGMGDGVDQDGDGTADLSFGDCSACIPGDDVCLDFIVDEDGDGIIDGFDLDCDGVIDIPLNVPTGGGNGGGSGSGSGSGSGGGGGGGGGGGSTSSSKCNSAQSINNDSKSVACESINGAPATCTCNDNGTITTCTDNTPGTCSIGSSDNCCGF